MNTFWLVCFKNTFHLLLLHESFQTLYTTNYKPTTEQHDSLIMIENVLTLLSCIYVQKYNCMNDNYFLCLIDHAFTLELCGWIENVALIHKGLKYTCKLLWFVVIDPFTYIWIIEVQRILEWGIVLVQGGNLWKDGTT